MTDYFIAGFVLFFICIIISRIISEKALKYLSSNQKTNIVDTFSNQRKYTLIPFVAILFVFIITVRLYPHLGTTLLMFFVVLMIAYLIVIQIRTSKKLFQLRLPKQYLKIYKISRSVYYFGFVCLLAGLLL